MPAPCASLVGDTMLLQTLLSLCLHTCLADAPLLLPLVLELCLRVRLCGQTALARPAADLLGDNDAGRTPTLAVNIALIAYAL